MAKKYVYEITDATGNLHCGTIDASCDSEALQRFSQDNLHYLSRTTYNYEAEELCEVVLVDSYKEEGTYV